MTSPSATLDIALVGATPGATNCDPALDLAAPGVAQKLTAYERGRTPEALAALPLVKGGRLTTFRVRPLTSAGVRVVMGDTGPRRAQNAVCVACHEFTDSDGVTHKAADHGGLVTSGVLSIATDEWLDFIADRYGYKAINEIASVIILRAEAGPAAVAPFALPLGLMLPR